MGGEHSRQREEFCVSKDSNEAWRLVEWEGLKATGNEGRGDRGQIIIRVFTFTSSEEETLAVLNKEETW